MSEERLKVLLVEDNPGLIELFRETLAEVPAFRLELATAETLAQALAKLEEASYDVALLDLGLPDSQGLETFLRLQAKAPQLPILILTGFDDETLAIEAARAGAQDYLIKGEVDARSLVRAMRTAVERKGIEESLRQAKEAQEARVQEMGAQLNEAAAWIHKKMIERREMELASRETEARYRFLFESVPQGVVFQDRAGQIIAANPAACRILGLTKDQILGRTSMDPRWRAVRLDGSDFPGQEHPAMVALRTGQTIHDEIMGVFNPQREEQRWIRIDAVPQFRLGEEKPYAVYTIFEDITEQRQAEQNLAWEAAINQTISQLARTIIASDSLETVSWLILEKAKQLTSSPLGFVGYIDPETGHLVAPTMTEEVWEACQVEGKSHIFKHFGGLWGWAMKHKQALLCNDLSQDSRSTGVPPGHLAIHRFLAAPAIFKGRLAGLIALANAEQDYTDKDLDLAESLASLCALAVAQKQAVDNLKKSEARFRTLVETMQEGLIELDAEHRFVFANERFCQMVGYSQKELLGQHCSITVDPSNLKLLEDQLARRRKGGRKPYELVYRRPDGQKVFTLISPAPLFDSSGRYRGTISVITDLTERKAMEEQLLLAQKLESIGQLAAGIAHEINTPTQFIHANVEFLGETIRQLKEMIEQLKGLHRAAAAGEDLKKLARQCQEIVNKAEIEELTNESADAVKGCLEGVDRISRIVESMRFFAHPGAAEKTAIDVNQAIENTITISRNEWKYYADLATDLEPGLPLFFGYSSQFNQALLNIIVNAAQAIAEVVGPNPEKKGKITITSRQKDGWIEIRISDTGPGIPEEIRSRVFDPFFTTKQVGKGTGQGLYIAHAAIVEKHGGTIDFETKLGQGTTFILRLPVKTEE